MPSDAVRLRGDTPPGRGRGPSDRSPSDTPLPSPSAPGHPIVGDVRYGGAGHHADGRPVAGHRLHARRLSFTHPMLHDPAADPVTIVAPPPDWARPYLPADASVVAAATPLPPALESH